MLKIFIIANGSNDLYESINNTFNEIYRNITSVNNVEIYAFYKIVNVNIENLWRDNSSNKELGLGAFIYIKGKIVKINAEKYLEEVTINNKKVKIMQPISFLKEYLNDNDENIVILNGHGGPFQSFLDLEIEYSLSLNTVKLCKELKQFKIDLLFLDMCAMNYIEVIYELLNKSKIYNIITYKDTAPLEGVKYLEMIKMIKENMDENNLKKILDINDTIPLLFISSKKLYIIEKIKSIQNELARETIISETEEMEKYIKDFKLYLNKVCYENKMSKQSKGCSLKYIKSYLVNNEERRAYNQYSYAQDNYWRSIVTRSLKCYSEISLYILLEESSLENIIYLHNSTMDDKLIEIKAKNFIREKNCRKRL